MCESIAPCCPLDTPSARAAVPSYGGFPHTEPTSARSWPAGATSAARRRTSRRRPSGLYRPGQGRIRNWGATSSKYSSNGDPQWPWVPTTPAVDRGARALPLKRHDGHRHTAKTGDAYRIERTTASRMDLSASEAGASRSSNTTRAQPTLQRSMRP